MSNASIVAALLTSLVVVSLAVSRSRTVSDFLYNAFNTRFGSVITSTVVSQIGAGSVVTVYAMSVFSPLTGVLIAFGIGAGLLTVAAATPRMIAISKELSAYGLLEIIRAGHHSNDKQSRLFMAPVYIIVLLKLATQLMALSLVVNTVFETGPVLSTAVSISILLVYVLLAGYKTVTLTDNIQFLIVAGFAALVFYFLPLPSDFVALTSNKKYPDYFPWILFAMLYLTTISSIPHWRRALTAKNPQTVRWAFVISAPIVALIILVFTTSGFVLGPESASSSKGLKLLFPPQLGWLIHAGMFMAIISSMDSVLVSLLTAGDRTSLSSIRYQVLGISAIIFVAAILFGDIVKTMVSTYSALLALFPSAFMVFLGRASNARVMIVSVFCGVIASVVAWRVHFTVVPAAALGASAMGYLISHWFLRPKTS